MNDEAKQWADMERAHFEAQARSKHAGAPKRRVVQLAPMQGCVAGDTVWKPTMFALCDDGSVWFLHEGKWVQTGKFPSNE